MQARRIDEIKSLLIESKDRVIELHNAIIGNVLSDPQLSLLNSTSAAAIWRLWAFITAVCLWIEECVYAQFVVEVETIAANAIPNTATWLRSMLYRFQYGHDLLFDNYRPYYATTDVAAQIVAQAAVVETTWGIVLVKVAKNGLSGLQPLTTLEIQAVEVYVDDIKPAGTLVQVISLNPDKLKVMADIYYDPLINLAALKMNIEKAIKGYLRNLPFDGEFMLTALEDAIQKVVGVKTLRLNYVGAQVGALPYAQITNGTAPAKPTYIPTSGYIEIDPAFPINTTIVYYPVL